MPVSALIVIALLGVFLMLRGKRAEPPASGLPGANGANRANGADGDAATLDELARAGSDLTREHNIEFFIYLPDQSSGEAAASLLRGEGHMVELSKATDGSDWLCLVQLRMIPDMAGLRGYRERFTALARAYNGEYDGWGTEVEDG